MGSPRKCSITTNISLHQSDAVTDDVDDGGRHALPTTTGQLELYADWSARILDETSAVGAQCFGPSDLYGLRQFDYVSEALMSLHWLRIERIQFKLAVLVHRIVHGNVQDCVASKTTSDRSLGCSTFHFIRNQLEINYYYSLSPIFPSPKTPLHQYDSAIWKSETYLKFIYRITSLILTMVRVLREMWPRSRRLGLETVSKHTDASPRCCLY